MSFKKYFIRILIVFFTGILILNILTSLIRNVTVMILLFITPIAVAFILLNIRELNTWIRKNYRRGERGVLSFKKTGDKINLLIKPFIPLINQICEDIKQAEDRKLKALNLTYGENYLKPLMDIIKRLEE